MNNIRVLHITSHLGGGVGKAISGLIMSGKNCIDSQIILLEKPEQMYYVDLLVEQNISVVIEPEYSKIIDIISKSDIVVINWWGHPLMIKLLKMISNVESRFFIWNHINGYTYPYLDGKLLQKFDEIIFTSELSKQNQLWSQDEKQNILDKSHVIYGMGNFRPQKIIPKKDYEIKEIYTIGYVGTINYAKMNPDILMYYKKVIKHFKNVKIIMLGEPSEKFLEDIKKNDLNEYFIFPGFVDNVIDFCRDMDVFAYLLTENSYATTENSLIEAMSVGLPIVVLDNPVERSIIKDKINGRIVKSPEEFISVLEWLRCDDNAKKLGESAREYCIRSYSSEHNFNEFYKICIEGIKKKKHILDLEDIIKDNPFENFLFQAVKEKKLFKQLIEKNNKKILKKIPDIYKEKNKGSIRQFAKYFPECIELQILERRINNDDN